MTYTGRFAPSTTGDAHLGTALAGLLAWLDAKTHKGRILLRLENIDPERCKDTYLQSIQDDMAWLGLHWDDVHIQSHHTHAHEQVLNYLAQNNVLYACTCTRAMLKKHGTQAPDGGWKYPNTCQHRKVHGVHHTKEPYPLRALLPNKTYTPQDLNQHDLTQNPSTEMGDPVVKRRDQAVAYHLAAVLDDANAGVTHVVRGQDIAPSTATQCALMELLGYTQPLYRHHFLLLEPQGHKLAKLHGSLPIKEVRSFYNAAQTVGFLAFCAGLIPQPTPCTPDALLPVFAWEKVPRSHRVVVVQNSNLVHVP
jgi:glutamyl/glutaminyl-tRNA synthetase